MFNYICIKLNKMNVFSISDLEKFSGIKAHTIRIWEQRYQALQPNRTEGNTRYYDGLQLKRLLNIVTLLNYDYKISQLCSMPDSLHIKLLEERMEKGCLVDPHFESFVSQLISAGMTYDEVHFEKIFSSCMLRFGMKQTYLMVIYPMLVTLGVMWSKNDLWPSQDHFISNMIKQKMYTAMDAFPPAKADADSWLLFLPENELHEIGLLFANYLLRLSGSKVVYLGANLPFESLKHAVNKLQIENLLFFMVHHTSHKQAQKYIDDLGNEFPNKNIYISGNMDLIHPLELGPSIKHLYSVEEMEKTIAENKGVKTTY